MSVGRESSDYWCSESRPGVVLRSADPTPRTVAFNDLLFAAWYSKQ
jgi:hypothetical protein